MAGFVSLVGAGPWAPDLLTLAGQARLARAQVVIADYLVNPALLLHCPPDCEIHQRSAGPKGPSELHQDATNALMIAKARAGLRVVRLKGGDPCMFGRGGEEAMALVAAGVEFEFVPGVSSTIAAAEAAGIPVTHRDHTPAVTFVSGWEAYDKAGLAVQWEHLARSAGTIVLLMSVRNAGENAQRLIAAGRDASTPAAAIRWGTRGIARTLVGTLATIAAQMEAANMGAPAVLVVGDVVGLRAQLASFHRAERRPLFGRRIVIARPRGQTEALAQVLGDLGADVVPFACLEIAPPPDVAALDVCVAAIGQDYDGVIVSSSNGAQGLCDALVRIGADARALAGCPLAAVGASTASALLARGLRADVVPRLAHSESLVAELGERGLLGRRWLHVGAATVRDVLHRAVASAGGRYHRAVAYQARRCTVAPLMIQSLLPRDRGGEGFDAVCFGSARLAQELLAVLGEAWGEAEARAQLRAAKLVAWGPVTARAMEDLGLTVAGVAAEPSIESIAEALQNLLAPPVAPALP